ncbi:NAD(P)-binding protein [Obba rivulosa]|uniref:NAD(P)-binding protein n=1 Tax=Obba rivulosa TaxID=1052685 RepID=A0A8E2DQ92_9APHY|nr:NAD(P)-binding protein [Obba rivulosa]
MSHKIPHSTRALIVQKSQLTGSTKPSALAGLPYDAVLEERPIPALGKGQVLVKVAAAAFNHRDLWIRKGQYPGIAIGSTYGADGAGTVVAADSDDPLLNKRVFLTPMRGWKENPDGPESRDFVILGGGSRVPIGTFTQYVVVERDEVIPTPDHLDDIHAAAWPLGGLTAWRAVVVNAQVKKGDNVLITGIGGGVALLAMQICIGIGAHVYVTSGQKNKIDKAVSLGAKAGVNYKDKNWPAELAGILAQANRQGGTPTELSAVIDSGGGDITGQTNKLLKAGGRIVVYGMTAQPKINFTMREVLKNLKLLGSTMGSRKDLVDATDFLAKHRIVPAVSNILDGLEEAEAGFELIQRGDQFGKVVICIRHGSENEIRPKL